MAKAKKREEGAKVEQITFQCRVCEKPQTLDKMVVITRFFPPIAACRDCEKKMR